MHNLIFNSHLNIFHSHFIKLLARALVYFSWWADLVIFPFPVPAPRPQSWSVRHLVPRPAHHRDKAGDLVPYICCKKIIFKKVQSMKFSLNDWISLYLSTPAPAGHSPQMFGHKGQSWVHLWGQHTEISRKLNNTGNIRQCQWLFLYI